ncbi:hypothetical protein FEM48_Zijuj03G0137300 [Ziziphus jujuba var. spinosa]|uniref:Leucine-rich repeat-containing N-terminal plant-type domain-containing protein n=1 Tax=Ziziphus jujuba var. spinosa TaxID=714518 RepID=A0A978VQN0_ZIZJJ|nr:hypothetical protein FEM48_Zijuj03G0137300 [Ziziphus jujuba var. spinosa]
MAKKLEFLSFSILFSWVVLLSFHKADALSNTEAEALIEWKNSLPNQSVFNSWVFPTHTNSSSTPPSPCKWYGITCNTAGNITQINLPSRGINGTLQNFDFSSFPNLLRLDLNENNLTGTIPINIGLMSNLQFLDLSTNSLHGSLPLSLANLTKVYELDISRNQIKGILDPRLFPQSSQSKTGLLSIKNLLFQDNQLGGRIPEGIGNLKSLRLLALDGNYFNGPIPSSFCNLSDLSILRLPNNVLSGEIPAELGTLTKLSDLRLFTNHLSGVVPKELGNLSSLTQWWRERKAQAFDSRRCFFSDCVANFVDLCWDYDIYVEKQITIKKFVGRIEYKDVVDSRLLPPGNEKIGDKLDLILKVGISCLSADPQARPTMRNVSNQLEVHGGDDRKYGLKHT